MTAPPRRRTLVRRLDGAEAEARELARLKGCDDGERGQWAPLPHWEFRRLVEYAQAVLAANPTTFIWREQMHRLLRVEQRWQVDTDWWSEAGRAHRDYFAAVTRDGLFCTLYFDHLAAAWFVDRIYD